MDEKIESIQRMQEYIEDHLYENISFVDIAKVSLYSPWYARRIFFDQFGISPTVYIRKLRLSKSALLLRDENIKIIDIAMDLGFQSVDGYQRAFFKEFGCNPKEYAKRPIPIVLFKPYGIKYQYLERKVRKMSKNVFISICEKPERKVIIKRGISAREYWTYCQEVGCDIWGILLSIKSMENEPICMWLPNEYIKEGTSEYVQGVEVSVDYDGIIPEGFDVITLPSCKYLKFQGEKFNEEDFEAAIEEIWDAEKKYDPKNIGYMYDDKNPRIQFEPQGDRGYIELVAIKEI